LFEDAAYLVDLSQDDDEIIDTFPISENGYAALTAAV